MIDLALIVFTVFTGICIAGIIESFRELYRLRRGR